MKTMQNIYLILFTLLFFVSCGSSTIKDNSPKREIKELDNNSTNSISNNAHNDANITIYVHGYRKGGFEKEDKYGNLYSNTFKRELIKFMDAVDFDDYDKKPSSYTHLVGAVEFYGDTPANYYSTEDIEEIDAISEQYGGGIPRYALVVGKFIKYVLKKTGAKRVNIVSTSMGSFISRWLIEKDVEHLASEEKIAKWMSVEGVVRGNFALSNVSDMSLLNLFFETSPDTDHMKYAWIEKNLTDKRSVLSSPLYKNMLVGQISLTDGSKSDALLKYIFPFYGGFQPNDGLQLLRDTYFESVDKNRSQILTHTIIHTDHMSVRLSNGAYSNIASFLKAQKRVRVTLKDATVNDIHEEISSSNVGSEIVFASYVFSPEAKEKWGVEDAIDERVFDSGALKVYNYRENEEAYALNQIIFDNFIQENAKELKINIEGFEIDSSDFYDIQEINRNNQFESLGKGEQTIPLKKGIYAISAEDWSGHIEVEMVD